MTIFILIDWFHPAYKAGGPVQSIANMVEHLSNYQFKIFCSNEDLNGEVLNVPVEKWIPYNQHTDVFYCSKKSFSIKKLKQEIELTKPDLLFINGIFSWNFNIKPIFFIKRGRKIISSRGMLHPGALSQKSWKKKFFLFLWNLTSIAKRIEYHASTFDEKKFVEKIFGKKTVVHIAPNFPRQFQKQQVISKSNGLNLISIGIISPMKNYLLILNALKSCTEKIVYHIYGPVKDEAYWTECKTVINHLPTNIIVHYHGDIEPAKVEAVLLESHVFILPSKSENFGHSIYEALSAGKPVITSHNTPWNNLKEKSAGININVNDNKELEDAITFFAKMQQMDLVDWSNAAHKYALVAVNIEDIKVDYIKMFSPKK